MEGSADTLSASGVMEGDRPRSRVPSTQLILGSRPKRQASKAGRRRTDNGQPKTSDDQVTIPLPKKS
jgi:hypothetical protein